jgi:hypothetical protein
MHPAVKKNIKGVEYMAWPMRVSGSRIVQYNRNSVNVHFRASSRVLKKFTYIAYIYTNSVGEKRFYVDDVSLDSKIL